MRLILCLLILLSSITVYSASMCETALKIQNQSIKFNLLHRQKHLRILEVPRFPEEIYDFSEINSYISEIEFYLAHISEITASLSKPKQKILIKDLKALYTTIRQFREKKYTR